MVERAVDRLRVAQQQRPLAEIVEHQRRQHDAQPGVADRQPAEVAHVGVERLGPGHRQHDGTQGHERPPAEVPEQGHAVGRVQRAQHVRGLRQLGEAEDREDAEPEQHHRPEPAADAGRAAALDQEQRHQHADRERQHVGPSAGVAVSSPSTAESTEIAGVISPSP